MSFLFFFMLLTMRLGTMFSMVETLTNCIMDHFKQLVPYQPIVVTLTCAAGFILGLSMCASGGIYMFELIDNTCASWNILLFAVIEVVLVAWLYGVDKFLANIKEMGLHLPKPVEWYWKACWGVISPLILITLVIVTFAKNAPLSTELYEVCLETTNTTTCLLYTSPSPRD